MKTQRQLNKNKKLINPNLPNHLFSLDCIEVLRMVAYVVEFDDCLQLLTDVEQTWIDVIYPFCKEHHWIDSRCWMGHIVAMPGQKEAGGDVHFGRQ